MGTRKELEMRRGRWFARGKAAIAAAVMLGAAMSIAACGGDSDSDGDTTLTVPLSFNPGALDPDVFYGNEGLLITTSCYDGLLKYENNTTDIVPSLAEDYEVSEDGLTYTFNLVPDAKFSDGSDFTAEDVIYSIERREAVDAGPAYMVEPIEEMTAVDDQTLELNLDRPINPFLDWLASPYGLKMVNQDVIEENEKGNDWGQEYLADHCAGTGPYDMTSANPGQRYELEANPNYWGEEPDFTTVELPVIPSFPTQVLQLREGDLDMMTHGLNKADVASFEEDAGFTVEQLPAISAINLWINPNKPNLQDSEVRRAIGLALDRETLVEEVYGDTARVYNDVFAPETLPPEHEFDVPYDLDEARAIMEDVPESEREITLQFTSDDATNQQIAGLISQQLNEAGFQIDQRGLPETEVFNFTEAPDSQRPDMIVLPQNPDDSSPSSFPQLQWLNDSAFFPPFDPETDKILFKAIETVDDEEALELYGEAADGYRELNVFVPIANTDAVIVARDGIGDIGVERQGLWTVDLAALTNE